MIGVAKAAASFALTRWVSRRGLSRDTFEHWQKKALHRWLVRDLPQAPFYESAPHSLSDLPVTNKAMLMAQFDRFNICGIAADQAWEATNGNRQIDGLTVGASTGTSGNRGLFIISEAEKFRWLGAIVAKTIGDLIWHRQRVAIILPQNTSLYESAGKTGRIDLRFFDLTLGPEQWRDDIETFSPTIMVAPPKILRHFAQEHFRLTPLRIFSAAETLDPVDRAIIEPYFKMSLDQIYMATEGLFAVTCRMGRLHLAEESVFFEFEPVGDGLVTPLVTAFRRQTQIMARYRMNDLLRLSDKPCPCGSPLHTVDEIVGRMDDVFHLRSERGTIVFTPDILRNAVLKADRRIDDFRLTQIAPQAIKLRLKPDLPNEAAIAATVALEDLFAARQAPASVCVMRAEMPLDTHNKLRRIQCHREGEQ